MEYSEKILNDLLFRDVSFQDMSEHVFPQLFFSFFALKNIYFFSVTLCTDIHLRSISYAIFSSAPLAVKMSYECQIPQILMSQKFQLCLCALISNLGNFYICLLYTKGGQIYLMYEPHPRYKYLYGVLEPQGKRSSVNFN